MLGQARRNTGQCIVVKVELSEVGDINQSAIFHRADLIVAESKPAEKNQWVDGTREKILKETKSLDGESKIVMFVSCCQTNH